jgi:TRAP-type C4-dicarboxylate transport system permease small subunit
METSIQEKRQRMVFRLSYLAACVSFIGLVLIVVAEVIVRWKVNQNFSFLGGFGLESLALLTLGLLAMLMHTNRAER